MLKGEFEPGTPVIAHGTLEGEPEYGDDAIVRFRAGPGVSLPTSYVNRGDVELDTPCTPDLSRATLFELLAELRVRLYGGERPSAAPGLTFEQLRAANTARRGHIYTASDDWTAMKWCCALCGEAGEAANFAKKIERDGPTPELLAALGRELADVVHYAELTATKLGLDLAYWVATKFNEVSVKLARPERLPAHPVNPERPGHL